MGIREGAEHSSWGDAMLFIIYSSHQTPRLLSVGGHIESLMVRRLRDFGVWISPFEMKMQPLYFCRYNLQLTFRSFAITWFNPRLIFDRLKSLNESDFTALKKSWIQVVFYPIETMSIGLILMPIKLKSLDLADSKYSKSSPIFTSPISHLIFHVCKFALKNQNLKWHIYLLVQFTWKCGLMSDSFWTKL